MFSRAALAIMLFATTAFAVELSVHTAGDLPAKVTITATAVTGRARPIVRSADVPAAVSLELGSGTSRIEVEAPGFIPVTRIVTGTAPLLPVTLWPAATVKGTFATTGADAKPKTLRVFWVAPPGAVVPPGGAVAPQPENGSGDCTIDGNAWSCRAPATRLDLRFEPKGFASATRTRIELVATKPFDVGAMPLRKGAPVRGVVKPPLTSKIDPSTASVQIQPWDVRYRAGGSIVRTAAVDEKGSFAFSDIAPGEYELVARQGKLRSQPMRIAMREPVRLDVVDPLQLEAARTLTVHITPEKTLEGKPWSVRIAKREISDGGVRLDPLASGVTDAKGTYTYEGVVSGPHAVNVSTGSEYPWATRDVEVGDASVDVEMKIPMSIVHGRVTLADKSLAKAKVIVGGKFTSPSATLVTDADGVYRGSVPFEMNGAWRVTVQADAPLVDSTIEQLTPERDSQTGESLLDLHLSGGSLSGTVVDDEGNPVADGRVNLVATAPTSTRTGTFQYHFLNGTFDLAAISPGEYRAQATAHSLASDSMRFVIAEDHPVDDVKFIVHKPAVVRGRVLANGAPVGDAQLLVHATDAVTLGEPFVRSGMDGSFEAKVLPAAREADILVRAPAAGLQFFHTALGADLVVSYTQSGGVLELEMPRDKHDSHGVLIHRGMAVMAGMASMPGMQRPPAGEGRYAMSTGPVEPGAYTLCSGTYADLESLRAAQPRDRCVSGVLASGGRLKLVAP